MRSKASGELVPVGVRAELIALARYAADNLAKAGSASEILALRERSELPGAALEDLPAWRGIAELLLTKDGRCAVRA